MGKNPRSLAGAAIYAAAIRNGEKRTQKEISIIVGVTETTIRKLWKELTNKLKLDAYFIS